uniref:Uncharacterized protein n=1 Tax=Arsenophonus nasoniae TaxID=638 RepID=D2TVU3_9GAMM|nr:hypothetical protein ARN_01440 [Arsenophonus nasoniae]
MNCPYFLSNIKYTRYVMLKFVAAKINQFLQDRLYLNNISTQTIFDRYYKSINNF